MAAAAFLRIHSVLRYSSQSSSDRKYDKDEDLTKRNFISVLGEGRYSVVAVPVLNPVSTCGVKCSPKHRRTDGTITQQSRRVHAHTLHVEKSCVFEQQTTEPAEDIHHPLKTHTAVLFYGGGSSLCYTLSAELQPMPRYRTTVLVTVVPYSPPLCPALCPS